MKEFIPVSTKFITNFNNPLPFDVYIERMPGKFTTIYRKNSLKDESQVSRYESKDVSFFYISKHDKQDFEDYIITLNDLEHYTKEQIFEILLTGLELNYEHLEGINEETKTNLELATVNVRNSLFLLENDIHTAVEIFKALSSHSQLLKHSYMVSLFSIVLAKKLGMSSNRYLLNIGLGAFLHDIGQTRIDPNIMQKSALSPREWDEIKDHPHVGLKILDHNKCVTSEVRSIIIQHHEQFNGRGYPNRLTNNLIYPPAKVVAIADGFCSLISKTSYRKTDKTPLEALEILTDDLGHYDPEYLDVFAKMILKK